MDPSSKNNGRDFSNKAPPIKGEISF